MYLRSQDILHVIFVLNGGRPVHLDLLLGLLLGLGFSKLYPKRHVALLFCVLWSLVISLSPPVSSLHWVRPGRTQHWLDLAPPRVVCAKLCSADGLSLSVLLRARALLLTLRGTFHWSSAPLGDILSVLGHIHTTGAESYVCGDIYIWKYELSLCFVDDVNRAQSIYGPFSL